MAMFGGPPGGMNSGDDMRARHRDLLRDTHHLHEARRLGFKTHFWTKPFIVLGVVIGFTYDQVPFFSPASAWGMLAFLAVLTVAAVAFARSGS